MAEDLLPSIFYMGTKFTQFDLQRVKGELEVRGLARQAPCLSRRVNFVVAPEDYKKKFKKITNEAEHLEIKIMDEEEFVVFLRARSVPTGKSISREFQPCKDALKGKNFFVTGKFKKFKSIKCLKSFLVECGGKDSSHNMSRKVNMLIMGTGDVYKSAISQFKKFQGSSRNVFSEESLLNFIEGKRNSLTTVDEIYETASTSETELERKVKDVLRHKVSKMLKHLGGSQTLNEKLGKLRKTTTDNCIRTLMPYINEVIAARTSEFDEEIISAAEAQNNARLKGLASRVRPILHIIVIFQERVSSN